VVNPFRNCAFTMMHGLLRTRLQPLDAVAFAADYAFQWGHPKIALFPGGMGPAPIRALRIHCSLGPLKSTTQTASQLVHGCVQQAHTDRPLYMI